MKSEFVSLMLPKIATTSLPTRKPNGWNEIAIIGDGGIAGLLISSVTKIAEPADCRRIVEAVSATNDPAKVAKLREAARLVPIKDEFEKLLKQVGSQAEGKGQNPTKLNVSSDTPSSSNVGKTAITVSPVRELTSTNSPEAGPAVTTEEPALSTPLSVIVGLIVVCCALLWLLLKRRK